MHHITSEIFSYDDYANAKELHVTLKSDNWYAEDIKPYHLQFHINLFGNSTVMAGFADGQVRSAESVTARVKNFFIKAFQCFDSKPLEQIDATASPSILALGKSL